MKNTDDRFDDCFRPPAIPIEVECVECGAVYDSSQIRWVPEGGPPGYAGAWCCPTPGCGGAGFLFDIWPTDPEWRDENGNLVCVDDDEEDDLDSLSDGGLLDTMPPASAKESEPKQPASDEGDESDIPF